MKDKINVIVGCDDDETLASLYSMKDGDSAVLILTESGYSGVAACSKRVTECIVRHDEYAALLTLLTGFDGYETVYVALTSDKVRNLFARNREYFDQRFVVTGAGGTPAPYEPRVRAKRAVARVMKRTKLDRVKRALGKAYHTDAEQYIVKGRASDIPRISCGLETIEVTKDNCRSLFDDALVKECGMLFKSENTKCLALTDSGRLAAEAFIKGRDSSDRMFRIKSDDSYVITLMHVEEEYRGRGLQRALISALAERFIADRERAVVYAYIYTYNVPSLKNFEKCGFEIAGRRRVRRFIRRTVNKVTI